MTTGSRPAPFRIALPHAGKRGLVLLDQIRTVDKASLVRKLGTVSAARLSRTLATLQESFAE